MGIIRKIKRTALAKALKERDLELQAKGFKANQARIIKKKKKKKQEPYRNPKNIEV